MQEGINNHYAKSIKRASRDFFQILGEKEGGSNLVVPKRGREAAS